MDVKRLEAEVSQESSDCIADFRLLTTKTYFGSNYYVLVHTYPNKFLCDFRLVALPLVCDISCTMLETR